MTTPSAGSDPLVLRRDENGICHLTMNRPKAYNALSMDMMSALIQVFADLSEDRSVRVVVLSGAGKGFCAGHDLKELKSNPDRSFYERTFQACSELMLSMTRSPKPVIAKVHGVATAAGCQLVATCDLAVAAENARFATPGVNIGLFCSTPMVALSRSVAKKQALEMLLLGDLISAQRAYEIGLLNRAVPLEQLDQASKDLAAKIASKSALTIGLGKGAFYEQVDRDLETAYEHCGRVMVENLMARDAQEGITAFFEKRTPEWTGK
jgi:enoyl-CoA hydratase/carnithine racemase